MGKIPQGILGGVRGSVGNVTGASWKGVNYLKTKPLSVANPRTSGQVGQRNKMSGVVMVAVFLLTAIVKPLWDRFASKMSGYNDFVRSNIALFINGVLATPANLVISKGKMAKTDIDSISPQKASHPQTINWVDDSGEGYKLATDIFYGVMWNESTDEWAFSTYNNKREDGESCIDLETLPVTGNILHTWIAFKRADGTIVSNTAYKTITVA